MIDVSWLLGLVIPGGVGIILLLVALLISLFATPSEFGCDWPIVRAVAGVIGVLALAGAVLGSLPWSAQYHTYVPKAGTVSSVHSRFSGNDDGGTDQNFVITIGGQHYLGTDSRFAGVKPGDYVRMLCERDFQFNTPDEGWSCNWGSDLGRFR